jgi:quercetin dioxygenase-like cupin family protein
MIHRSKDPKTSKGWFIGPWDSDLPIPVGFANAGVNEKHVHQKMYEVYLIANGHSTAVVNGKSIKLKTGDMLIVEPGEVHTFINNSRNYFHFVLNTPFIKGDKVLVE